MIVFSYERSNNITKYLLKQPEKKERKKEFFNLIIM